MPIPKPCNAFKNCNLEDSIQVAQIALATLNGALGHAIITKKIDHHDVDIISMELCRLRQVFLRLAELLNK